MAQFETRRLRVPASDGSGDCQQAVLNAPLTDANQPLLLLVHGLAGSEDSDYLRASACYFLEHGYSVLRVNLRGAGPSSTTCRVRYCAGSSTDLSDLIADLPAELVGGGVVVMGFSLGANILLKFLGEPGGARRRVLAAVSVCAPIDLAATCRNILRWRNAGYHRWFLSHMKAETLASGVPLDAGVRSAITRASTIYEFDECFTAPSHGYANADDYYRQCSAQEFLEGINVPTLVITAQNDPIVPFAPYRAQDWRRATALTCLFPRSGGHVGFHGQGSSTPWHDRCARRWFQHAARLNFRARARQK